MSYYFYSDLSFYNKVIQIQSLNETNFQEFLSKNLKNIFVYETKDYEYQHYFPSHCVISKSSRAEGKFARQWG